MVIEWNKYAGDICVAAILAAELAAHPQVPGSCLPSQQAAGSRLSRDPERKRVMRRGYTLMYPQDDVFREDARTTSQDSFIAA